MEMIKQQKQGYDEGVDGAPMEMIEQRRQVAEEAAQPKRWHSGGDDGGVDGAIMT
jgi:hypothetical protein